MAPPPPTCPNCGAVLIPVAEIPDTPPWLCNVCSRGWWPSELSPQAQAAWRPEFRDYGDEGPGTPASTISQNMRSDHANAVLKSQGRNN